MLPGLFAWLAVCAAFVALDTSGLTDGLTMPVPLILALAVAHALASREWTRRHRRLAAAIPLALAALAVASWHLGAAIDPLSRSQTVVALAAGAALALLLSSGALRRALLPPLGLEPGSPVHVVVFAAILVTLVGSALLFVQLAEATAATVPFYATDSIVAIVSDVGLALAGVGFLITRGVRATIRRLGLRPLTARQLVWIAVVAVGFHVAVGALDWAERVWLPGLHALEDRFDYDFVGVSPLVGAVLVSVSAGVGEELLFRGALQPRVGVVLSALVFAALHLQYQVPGIVMIFLVGVGLGLLRRRTSTTFTAAVHVVYDLGAFLIDLSG